MKALLRAIENDELALLAAPEIKPLAEHPEYRAQSKILARISAEIESLDHQVNAHQVAEYLRQTGRDAAPAFIREGGEVDLALRILDGDESTDLRSSAEVAAAARAKADRLRPGLRAQREQIERLRERLSAAACEGLRDRHRTVLLNLFAACRAVARAAAAERSLYREIAAAGFSHAQHILPPSQMGACAAFDEIGYDSGLNHFKRQLQALGIISE